VHWHCCCCCCCCRCSVCTHGHTNARQRLAATAAHAHPRALLAESERDGAPDAARAASDNAHRACAQHNQYAAAAPMRAQRRRAAGLDHCDTLRARYTLTSGHTRQLHSRHSATLCTHHLQLPRPSPAACPASAAWLPGWPHTWRLRSNSAGHGRVTAGRCDSNNTTSGCSHCCVGQAGTQPIVRAPGSSVHNMRCNWLPPTLSLPSTRALAVRSGALAIPRCLAPQAHQPNHKPVPDAPLNATLAVAPLVWHRPSVEAAI
jgi:hypothetical protein